MTITECRHNDCYVIYDTVRYQECPMCELLYINKELSITVNSQRMAYGKLKKKLASKSCTATGDDKSRE